MRAAPDNELAETLDKELSETLDRHRALQSVVWGTVSREGAHHPVKQRGVVSTRPHVWLLATHHVGDRKQMLNLAQALGGPFEEKRLRFNLLSCLPNLILDDVPASLDRRQSSSLAPPWPDIVIASGRRSVPVARWIKRCSGGRTRLIHVGRPWARLELFDLVITTPQYSLPERDNVLINALTLNRVEPSLLREAATIWAPRLAHLPKPRIAVLIGGDVRPYRLAASEARRLACEVSELAAQAGGSLLATISARTSPEARDAFIATLAADVPSHHWTGQGENPYCGYLALADRFVVTGESASMLSEACSTGRPVFIRELPECPDARLRLGRRFRALAKRFDQGNSLGRLYELLVDLGLVTSTRDMRQFHNSLIEHGLAMRLGEAARGEHRATRCDGLSRAVQHVQRLERTHTRPSGTITK